MDVVRLNFSYGTHREHAGLIERVRSVEKELGHPIGIMQDLQGPKIRLGALDSPAAIQAGQVIEFTTSARGSRGIVIDYPGSFKELRKSDRILIGDEGLTFRVIRTSAGSVSAEAQSGGMLKSRQGVHFPDSPLAISSLTAKDLRDIRFALKHGLDFIAVSFVRSAADLLKLRRMLRDSVLAPMLIPKIETPEAVNHLDEILAAGDGAIVARGDLGLVMGLEEVPLLQKKILRRASYFGKVSVTATQMLESMIGAERPTRAEVSDVANAVLDGTDAVLLSGETAIGRNPAGVVRTMSKILHKAEEGEMTVMEDAGAGDLSHRESFAIACSAAGISEKLQIARIVSLTYSGTTALRISKFRPKALIVGMTPNETVLRIMALFWGVRPLKIRKVSSLDEMFKTARKALMDSQPRMGAGKVLLIAGIPFKKPGITNLLKIHDFEEKV